MGERIAGKEILFALGRTSAFNFAAQAFKPARHCPVMIPFEDWLEDRRQQSQQRFVGSQTPVKGDESSIAFRRQRPFSATYEIACGFNFYGVRFGMLDDFRSPAKVVMHPASGKEMNFVSDVVFSARRLGLGSELLVVLLARILFPFF